ncbi:sulfotransferase 1A1-like [Gigantopelta aegis]|uniref:sulfotransferase 1A1-like n=1 Tax=Gigantopelta aegis TaxID=1735272 RepID=UPI001B88D32A|nr:sulfotransferase 1A1-like [Gigantopelta aegis]
MEDILSEYVTPLRMACGVLYPHKVLGEDMTKTLCAIQALDTRPDDIFLCSFLKSGTHWLYEILNMLVQGQAKYTRHWKNSNEIEVAPLDVFTKMMSPRIFQTHLRFEFLPQQLRMKGRIVYVERDPKSVCVSLLNFLKFHNLLRQDIDWSLFLNMFVDGKVPFGSWFHYVREWRKVTKDYPNIPLHVVFFEDMKEDPLLETRKLSAFLGLDLSETVLKDIVDACSFENLKEAHKKKDSTYAWIENAASHYFWKGTTDEWKNWFTVAQSEYLDKVCEERGVTRNKHGTITKS